MFSLVSRKFLAMRNITLYSVFLFSCNFHFFFASFFSGQSTNGNSKDKQLNGNSNGDNGLDIAGTASEADLDAEDKDHKMNDVQINHSSTLKIDKNLVPVDLRLHGYLSNLAKVCT